MFYVCQRNYGQTMEQIFVILQWIIGNHRQNRVMRIYSPLYTPQANGVVKQTIRLVKNWIGKNAKAE